MSNKITAVIVDDEGQARESLRRLLQFISDSVEVVDEVATIMDAAQSIETNNPDVVFLDIQLDGQLSFELFEVYPDLENKLVVFVTAHDHYAIRAIKLSAFDYILKPVDLDELSDCVKRLNEKLEDNFKPKFDALKSNLHKVEKVAVASRTGIEYVPISDLLFLEASGMYTVFHLQERQVVASKPVKEFEQMLPETFFRSHRGYLVNMKLVEEAKGQELKLVNGQSIPIARSKMNEFKSKWK
ncbi:LytTR family two component transcriptional regulator [Roseivirga pacifica]|uniref:Two component transcriptional regulator, LytTR family n=1 Tax=Roseivirga pacifica TaxID=1267423 RepID=A0A1I0MHF1_9BACT|nr:LytTR family DNA-binding domain-containing protein [Roseivirga pacifica]RKQ50367.1 LytTR family two component transcriptional regulator [Roseivirga pacifica]SEV87226.1 two component transcriptional regulator, LytTR family [Roseivirga pacifica]